jgi:putative DNA primase/helicase
MDRPPGLSDAQWADYQRIFSGPEQKPDYLSDEEWEENRLEKARKERAKGKRAKGGNGAAAADDEPIPAYSDEAIALLFAERHAANLRFVALWGKWLIWEVVRWRIDETIYAFDRSRILCREIAATYKGKRAATIASARTVAAIATLARADRRIAATSEQWDRGNWILNTPDGVVDLRTGAMRAHRPEDYLIKITAVGPRGDCPKFKAFLSRIMGGDEALVAFLQRLCGYCLTGEISEQAIFFNYGEGQNGKSVLMSTVAGILGDYCLATAIETFTETKHDRHPTELASLRGARLVTATETEAGRYWAESRLKELTGGEPISARFMHKDPFQFLPQFKPWISGNHRPRLRSVGKAMRRRVKMIPFKVTIPEGERDIGFAGKLKDEWPGILNWMIEGVAEWLEHGLAAPEAVTDATEDYFAREDSYSEWIAERCEVGAGWRDRSSRLFASWKGWAEKAGQPARDSKRFREELERIGFEHKALNDANYFQGLRIRQDDPPPEDDLVGGL